MFIKLKGKKTERLKGVSSPRELAPTTLARLCKERQVAGYLKRGFRSSHN